MRTIRIFATVAAAMLAVGMITSGAGAKPPASGTWTYTDTTPDPTTLQNDATQHCEGTLPTSPADVNSYPFKAKKTGVLSLTAHNSADWAMEVKDSKGNIITGTDGADVNTPENMVVTLRKGSYEVIYCNFAGEATITVDYSFVKSKVRGG
jgi:hypothetical protein